MKKQAIWDYDLVSPYAFLQAAALPALAERLEITAIPILFAGDSEGMLRSYLDDPAGYDHPDALRLETIPETATRKRA